MIKETAKAVEDSQEGLEDIRLSCTVIAQGSHPITQKMLDPDALFVLKKLQKAGFSAYLVGGGVRDLYLGNKPKDFDISTSARPGQLRKLFRNSNTIGRRFRLVQVFFKHNKVIEVSTLRSLSEHDLDGPEAILAPNNTFGTLDQDAQRRDLTINSLFYEIDDHSIIDYVGGVDDLDAGIIRMVGEPGKRITRDPVRIMRAIRHCARNESFYVEDNTWQAILEHHDKLSLCPPSRLRDEFLKDLYSGKVSPWYELAAQANVFTTLFKCYQDIFLNKFNEENTCREELSRLFEIIDSMNNQAVEARKSRQPDYFLLALILIPWAESEFKLLSEQVKGSAAFQLGKKIRADLDQNLGIQLNLRRSLRQEITTLLVNLPLFIIHDNGKNWPKWLQKKSYFQKCLLFYQFFNGTCKIDTGIEEKPIEKIAVKIVEQNDVATKDVVAKETKPQQVKAVDTAMEARSRDKKSRDKIALYTDRTGGIFGFRKD
ncbi:MAG: polya polymerase [Desulfotalea sp.]